MRYSLLFFVVLIVIPFSTFGDIRDSHHDFSNNSWSNGEICLPCHTPMHANVEIPQTPLWNHEITQASFDLYSSPSLNAFQGQPGGTSKLCLSCHDGTIAIENHSGSTTGTQYSSFGAIGTDLQDDHPISIVYDDELANTDGALYRPSDTPSGLGGTIAEDFLVEGRLECNSCHDIHVSRNMDGCSGCHNVHDPRITRTLSLRVLNDGSALCLTCHKK